MLGHVHTGKHMHMLILACTHTGKHAHAYVITYNLKVEEELAGKGTTGPMGVGRG